MDKVGPAYGLIIKQYWYVLAYFANRILDILCGVMLRYNCYKAKLIIMVSIFSPKQTPRKTVSFPGGFAVLRSANIVRLCYHCPSNHLQM